MERVSVLPHLHGSVEADTMNHLNIAKTFTDFHRITQIFCRCEVGDFTIGGITRFADLHTLCSGTCLLAATGSLEQYHWLILG